LPLQLSMKAPLPKFCSPPTPPPVSMLLTSWQKVLCRKCHKGANCIAGSCIGYIRLSQSQKTMHIC
jgi:hypothetical protein